MGVLCGFGRRHGVDALPEGYSCSVVLAYFKQYQGYTPGQMRAYVLSMGFSEGNYRAAQACVRTARGMTAEPNRDMGSNVR